jgi:hypothetical protein
MGHNTVSDAMLLPLLLTPPPPPLLPLPPCFAAAKIAFHSVAMVLVRA